MSDFSTLILQFYKIKFRNRLEFSCFAAFLEGFSKPEKRMDPPVEGTVNSMEQKTQLMS
jgi:hypothetical protein